MTKPAEIRPPQFCVALAEAIARRDRDYEREPDLGPPAAALKARPRIETPVTIAEWAVARFGRAQPSILAARASREMQDLLERIVEGASVEALAEEAADVCIVLYSLCGQIGVPIDAAIDAKMRVNRLRSWSVDNYGRGYRLPAFDPESTPARQLALAIVEGEIGTDAARRMAWALGATEIEAEQFVTKHEAGRAGEEVE